MLSKCYREKSRVRSTYHGQVTLHTRSDGDRCAFECLALGNALVGALPLWQWREHLVIFISIIFIATLDHTATTTTADVVVTTATAAAARLLSAVCQLARLILHTHNGNKIRWANEYLSIIYIFDQNCSHFVTGRNDEKKSSKTNRIWLVQLYSSIRSEKRNNSKSSIKSYSGRRRWTPNAGSTCRPALWCLVCILHRQQLKYTPSSTFGR